MVRLTKIYTRTGDDGSTRLGDMSETVKHDPRVEAYGAVDEANACLGVARAALERGGELDAMLERVQNELFDLGADLCVPESDAPREWTPLRMRPDQAERLEGEIDALNARLDDLDSFILPAGTEAAARLHLARTVVRRAERRVSAMEAAGETASEPVKIYLNRLSDLLFVAARIANLDAGGDVKWTPGGDRTG